jgi:hypothetical protein
MSGRRQSGVAWFIAALATLVWVSGSTADDKAAQTSTFPQKFGVQGPETKSFGFAVTQPGPVVIEVQSSGAPIEVTLMGPASRPVKQRGSGQIRLLAQATPQDIQRSPYWAVQVRTWCEDDCLTAGKLPRSLGSIMVQHPRADPAKVQAGSASGVRTRAAQPPQLSSPQVKQAYGSQLRKADALRRFGTPAVIQQDLNIFATPIAELPSPIAMTPASGSYQASCTHISQVQTIRVGSPWTMTTLMAQCRNVLGAAIPARLNDPQLCVGDIANSNGELTCQRGGTITVGKAQLNPFALPAGSWQQTCRDAYHHLQAREVRAQCRTLSGAWRYTSLNTAFACTSVSNDDGWLSCDSAPLPRGPWRAHCKEASIPLPEVGFSAICRRQSDGAWQRTTVGPCTKEVDTLDGHLTCGLIAGLPGGNWSERCRPVNWDAAEPAITLVCRLNDQTQAAYRVPLSTCPNPVTLYYDGSGPRGFLC